MSSLAKWDDYSRAKDAMMFNTNTNDAPWTIIRSDDKKRGRINCMRHFLNQLDYTGKDHDVVTQPDPRIAGSAETIYEKDESS